MRNVLIGVVLGILIGGLNKCWRTDNVGRRFLVWHEPT